VSPRGMHWNNVSELSDVPGLWGIWLSDSATVIIGTNEFGDCGFQA
jgi:hypothetical protein